MRHGFLSRMLIFFVSCQDTLSRTAILQLIYPKILLSLLCKLHNAVSCEAKRRFWRNTGNSAQYMIKYRLSKNKGERA
jgi:hypothetical protein